MALSPAESVVLPDTVVARHAGGQPAGPPERARRLRSMRESLERFFDPDDTLADGKLDPHATWVRNVRVVATIAGASMVTFVPALVVAGVPAERWPAFLAGALASVVTISAGLLAVERDTRGALVAAAVNSLVIAGLSVLLGDYFHEITLLFAVVLAGHAVLHGFRAAFVMAVFGSIVVPFEITAREGFNPTDPVYAFVYLTGIAGIIWIRQRLLSRRTEVLEASEERFRALVETVPAVVYRSGFGPNGEWQYVSPQVEALLGYPATAWTSDPGFWWSLIHPDDRELVQAEETETWGTESGKWVVVEYRMLARDGRVRWIRDEATVIWSASGQPDHWSGFLSDVTDRRVLEEQLKRDAFHDSLTGLANRALFGDRVTHALARAGRGANRMAVMFLDLDDFKMVNDGIGHSAGDALLKAVAERIVGSLRAGDTAARLGGDEFGILVEDLKIDTASIVARRILEALARPFVVEGQEIFSGASIGIARPDGRGDTTEQLLRRADAAMYSAKGRGKGRFEEYRPGMNEAALARLQRSAEIRQALEANEFIVHYQPIVRLDDRSLYGYEALARWAHGEQGLIMPADFIAVAEESGLIWAIGERVLEAACRQACRWRDGAGAGPGPAITVNVSARQFREDSLAPAVAAVIGSTGIDPASLVLEITESVIMDDSHESLNRLRRLKRLGVRLAIDDFGTGFSSLGYLRRLPVDILKVDKSFIDEISVSTQALELTRVVVQMGKTLGLTVVAEGVETAAQEAALLTIGCELAQGYRFAEPSATGALKSPWMDPAARPDGAQALGNVRGGSRRSRLDAVPVKIPASRGPSATRQGHLSRRLYRLP